MANIEITQSKSKPAVASGPGQSSNEIKASPQFSQVSQNNPVSKSQGVEQIIQPHEQSIRLEVVKAIPATLGAIAWPLVLAAFICLFRKEVGSLLTGMPRWIKKIKGAGVEIEINKEAAGEIRAYFKRTFEDLIAGAQKEYEQVIEVHRVTEKLQAVVEALPSIMRGALPSDARATIYVPDILFKDYLYQLTNYWPMAAGHKAGRRFSQRYGIIGRCWRLRESIGRGEVISSSLSTAQIEHELISEWGMLPGEATTSRGQPAYLCVILKDSSGYQGLIYIDSGTREAFGDDVAATKLSRQLEATPEVVALAAAISKAIFPLREAGPFIEISQIV